MSPVRVGMLVYLLTLALPLSSQQSPPTVTKDPQAIDIANQALTAVGGIDAILAISDYTASGSITHHFRDDVSGRVTIKGDANHFRMDSSLPNGTYSRVTSSNATVIKTPEGSVGSFSDRGRMGRGNPMLPFWGLLSALKDQKVDVLYEGLSLVDGHNVHDIRVQPFSNQFQATDSNYPGSVDYYIDPHTFQIVSTMEFTARRELLLIHKYSGYRLSGSVLIPFSVAMEMSDQLLWNLTLTDITFNSGLQESDFQIN